MQNRPRRKKKLYICSNKQVNVKNQSKNVDWRQWQMTDIRGSNTEPWGTASDCRQGDFKSLSPNSLQFFFSTFSLKAPKLKMNISFFVSPFLNVDQHESLFKKKNASGRQGHTPGLSWTNQSEFFGGSACEWEGRDDQLVSPQGTWCRRVSEEATKRWAHAPIAREGRITINQKKKTGAGRCCRWTEVKSESEDAAALALVLQHLFPVAGTAAVVPYSYPDVLNTFVVKFPDYFQPLHCDRAKKWSNSGNHCSFFFSEATNIFLECKTVKKSFFCCFSLLLHNSTEQARRENEFACSECERDFTVSEWPSLPDCTPGKCLREFFPYVRVCRIWFYHFMQIRSDSLHKCRNAANLSSITDGNEFGMKKKWSAGWAVGTENYKETKNRYITVTTVHNVKKSLFSLTLAIFTLFFI